MRPFKMFFGIAIGIIFFMFIARIAVIAFIAAAIMSIIYAIYRRVKDFVTYDRYGEYYIKGHNHRSQLNYNWNNRVEPLFQEHIPQRQTMRKNRHFIDTL